ncbi:MAG: DUF805 domain-containing protein [Deltaproteobacteria bacterium]
MDRRKFLYRLSMVTVGSLMLAAGLRLGFGDRWFSFYGWATVALTTVPFLTVLLWKRLPDKGRSRWWSVLIAVPVLAASLLQIVFWQLFFGQGGADPTLGVAREMLRPLLDAALPYLMAAVTVAALSLIGISASTGNEAL